MNPEVTKTLRYALTVWLFAAANCADQLGAATRETFGSLGLLTKPKRKRGTPSKAAAPSWLQEHRQVEEKTWPK